ncbi:MAG: TetR/AcrR family transcriptional regulator C-terminal domain-containing protein [Mobilicoccus sp.]|nr:TetR/AcrR family transcriptional regulator C-terminal domain-containing protein [Mobilicoccus sp.]
MTGAVVLADAEGLDAITMRAVAGHLGFKVMSLYNHVAGKDDLLEAMVDAVLADVDPPAAPSWRDDIVATATALNGTLREHRWATHLWPLVFPGPHRWRLAERLLADLAAADLPPERQDLGFHLVVNHIVGFSHLQGGYAAIPEAEGRARFEREQLTTVYPHLEAHARFHATDRREARPDEFRLVLDLILDSL